MYYNNFWNEESFSSKETVQILTYSEIISRTQLGYDYKKILPYFYSITNPYDGYLKCHIYDTKKKAEKRNKENVEDYLTQRIAINKTDVSLRDDFNLNLKNILSKLLDKKENFTQTENLNACEICPYNKICNKNNG